MPPSWSISGTSTAAGRNAVLGGVIPGFRSWSPRIARRSAAASAGSALPPKPRRPGRWRARRAMIPSRVMDLLEPIQPKCCLDFLAGVAEREEHAAAPYPELPLAGDL